VIGDDLGRPPSGACQCLAQEGGGGLGVPVRPEQDVHDRPVLVDGPVRGVLVRAPEDEDRVQVARAPQRETVRAHFGREERTEGLHPPRGGALGEVDAPLRQQRLPAGGGAGWRNDHRTANKITSAGHR
jgi:hypothetical protein